MPCESKDAEEEECKGESKAECKYEALDDDLISDMSNGDAQMRRLVRHRLNAQQEEADALYCKRLLREERFAKGLAKSAVESDYRLAALAQHEEMKEAEAKLAQEDADESAAKRLDRELKDEALAKETEKALRGAAEVEAPLAELKGFEGAKALDAKICRANFVARKRRDALAEDDERDDVTVGDKWRDAMKRVELEDVGDAVGVSVRLPSLANVKVSNKGKHVVVTAYRAAGALRASNRATKEGGPKQITLKFEMVCSKTAEDVSYDYDCESGYLHLFLDGIKLAALSDQQRDDTMKSLRSRLAASAAAKFSDLKKAFSEKDDAPDLSLTGLGLAPPAAAV